MTSRAIVLGLGLGLFISVFSLFNDGVIGGSWFIGNHFPTSVFGAVVVLLLIINPLLRLVHQGAALRGGEVAVITAIGLAACGWPSFGFYHGFVFNVATPQHWMASKPAWQANQVMSYVPGVSAELGYGHVQDWPSLAAAVAAGGDAGGTGEAASIAAQVWFALNDHERQAAQTLGAGAQFDERLSRTLLGALNRVIRDDTLTLPPQMDARRLSASAAALLAARGERELEPHERAHVNRWLLTASFPRQILPPPAGEGLLVAGGADAQRVRTMVIQGDDREGGVFAAIPWGVWWPTLRLWAAVALLLGVASLCLSLIVHPQWSHRELLVYPLAQFVTEIGRQKPGHVLPQIASQRLFWIGLIGVTVLHGVNGLATWFPALEPVKIPLLIRLDGLAELFPSIQKVPERSGLLKPYLYLSAIGFAYFLNTRVSFSVGIANLVYVIFAAALLSRGVSIDNKYLDATQGSLLRFGAYLGMAGTIVYIGRQYYGQLAMRAVGVGPATTITPGYAVWAARGLAVAFVAAVVCLRGAGLDWVLSTAFVLLVLVMFLVLTRIVSETGLFFVQSWWMPVAILTATFGIEAIGPTSYIVLALATILIVGDPRTTLMPYLATGLQIVERSRGPAAGDGAAGDDAAAEPGAAGGGVSGGVGGVLLVMVVLGFFAAGAATMAITHRYGATTMDRWATQHLPSLPFDELTRHLATMRGELTLAQATAEDGLTSLSQFRVSGEAWGWIAAGVVLIVLCSTARLRLPWWPIHPVLFLIWGTMPASRLGVSFLIGWLIKLAVLKSSGTRGYRAVLPLMIGMIAGELLASLTWISVGALYYLNTGMPPLPYRIYP